MGAKRSVALAGAALGWFALVLQFALTVGADNAFSVAGRIVHFFSYFTILSNILVAAVLSAVAAGVRSGRLAWLATPRVMAAAALYIGVTGLVYVLILRSIWDPKGWSLVADALLHYAMPLFYLALWALFVPRGRLGARDIPALLAFPMVYAAYSLVRGPLAQWYPYPFLELDRLGVVPVAVNVVLLFVGFCLFAAMLIAFDRIVAAGTQR